MLHFTQVPEVVDFNFNMTLGTSQAARASRPTQFVESVTFPLFLGGERRSRAQWASPGSLPGSMQLAYDASQMQLLCVAEVGAGFHAPRPTQLHRAKSQFTHLWLSCSSRPDTSDVCLWPQKGR